MKRWFRRQRATFLYLRQPCREFLPTLLLMIALVVAGGWSFQVLYVPEPGEPPMTLARGLYVTYGLIFMEHLSRLPDHWLLDVYCVVLPPLGLVVILDAFGRFGYHLLRRDETGQEWIRAMAQTFHNHVILVGLGKVGMRVLEQLIHLKEDVVVLERDEHNEHLEFARKHGVPIRIASSRQAGILDELNISQAKSLIAATDDDLANLEVALDARKAHPEVRIVLRMFDQEMASKVRDAFDIHTAFSTSALAAPVFATSSSDRSIINSFYVDGQLMVVAQLTISSDSKLAGRKIRDLGSEHQVFFLAHKRGPRAAHFPVADTEFQIGDEITVQTQPETLKLLHRWNGDKPPY